MERAFVKNKELKQDYQIFMDIFESDAEGSLGSEVEDEILQMAGDHINRLIDKLDLEQLKLINLLIYYLREVDMIWLQEKEDMAFEVGWYMGKGDLKGVKEVQRGHADSLRKVYAGKGFESLEHLEKCGETETKENCIDSLRFFFETSPGSIRH